MSGATVCKDHLASLPADFAALSDCELVSRGNVRFPVHKAILARYSGHARSLLSAAGDGEVAAASNAALAQALSQPLADSSDADVTAFLKLLYSLPNRRMLAQAICSVEHDPEAEDVIFNFTLDPVLKLAKVYDCPDLFVLCEQALLEEPVLKLAVLMSPLRWLLLFDEYQHMGYFQEARTAAISHLSAKFATLRSDPLLALLSSSTLVDIVRMLGHRLDTLSQTCSHVRAVQDRSLQRFSALAQEVAAPYCPDLSKASQYVTHWAVSTSSRNIKLSWALEGGRAAEGHPQQAVPPPAPAPAGVVVGPAQHAVATHPAQHPAQHPHQHQHQVQQAGAMHPPFMHMPQQVAAAAQHQQAAAPPAPAAAVAAPEQGQLAGSWQAMQQAQALIAQQQAVMGAMLAQMEVLQEERAQHLELLANQAVLADLEEEGEEDRPEQEQEQEGASDSSCTDGSEEHVEKEEEGMEMGVGQEAAADLILAAEEEAGGQQGAGAGARHSHGHGSGHRHQSATASAITYLHRMLGTTAAPTPPAGAAAAAAAALPVQVPVQVQPLVGVQQMQRAVGRLLAAAAQRELAAEAGAGRHHRQRGARFSPY